MNSISWNLLYAVKTLYFPSTSSEKFSAVREEKPAWHMMWKLPSQMAEAKQKHFFFLGGAFLNGEYQAFIPPHNHDSNLLGTVSLKKRRKRNLSWNWGSQKNGEHVLEVA